MPTLKYVVATDRGGHLHNALELIRQIGVPPTHMITTNGPDIEALKDDVKSVEILPHLFSWKGKRRTINPLGVLRQIFRAFILVNRLRPEVVVSLGATNVVFFCYWAKLFGARVFHVECMNQVRNPSVTGKMLYPISTNVYVQWRELLEAYGPKARYEGWVL